MNNTPIERLAALLEEMHSHGRPFNAVLAGPIRMDSSGHEYRDVSVLALVDNGEGWEAVAESKNGLYDLWFKGHLKEPDLSKEVAAERLLAKYTNAKIVRVAKRLSGRN